MNCQIKKSFVVGLLMANNAQGLVIATSTPLPVPLTENETGITLLFGTD